MTNPEIISILNAKLVPWLQANGVTQVPVIEEDKNFTPAVGFVPSVDVKWRRLASTLSQSGAVLADYVSRGAAAETAMRNVFQEITFFTQTGAITKTWTDFLSPHAAPATPIGLVGPEIPAATVAMQSQYHPQIDPGRKYFQLNGVASEGAEAVADGKRYRVVMPTSFSAWLELLVG